MFYKQIVIAFWYSWQSACAPLINVNVTIDKIVT